MSLHSEQKEISSIVNRLLDSLAQTVSSQTGTSGAALRRQIGEVRANFMQQLRSGEFSSELLACFTAATDAGVKLDSLANVRQRLFEEAPQGEISALIVQSAIMYCLSAESRMIVAMEFASRNAVDAMMARMKLAFDTAREIAAEAPDSTSYQKLIALAGALTQHLAIAARPLPRMIKFTLKATFPALTLSQRLYYDATRWEELVSENKIFNPAFSPRDLIGLSS